MKQNRIEPVAIPERSQSLPVNKFNSKFIFVNREKGKLRLYIFLGL